MVLAQSLDRVSVRSLRGVVGCPHLGECCMDGCEMSGGVFVQMCVWMTVGMFCELGEIHGEIEV